MKVWIAFTGSYEQRGSIGPAFLTEEAAKLLAEDGDVEEFEVFDGVPVKVTHYTCYGWLSDPRESCHPIHLDMYKRVRPFEGFWIDEERWGSWDVLVPDPLEVKVEAYTGRGLPNFANANGRNREAVRTAVISALAELPH